MDPEKFESRWNSHIDEFEKLKGSLPSNKHEELEEHINELKELVEFARDVVDDKRCWRCGAEVGGPPQERCGSCGVDLQR